MSKRKLTDICSIQYGCAFDASQFTTLPEEGMPLIRIRDVKDGCTNTYYKGDYSDEYIIHKGDYLVGMDGEFNIEPWQSEDALLNQRVCKIESKSEDVLMRYIYRFLKKELKRIEDDTPFVTVKHLSAKRLNQVLISVPPLPEQEKIVSELDCLSGIIEKKRQQLKELDALAQSIFYEMFGNPVDNERGWEVKKLKNVFSVKIGPFGSLLHHSDYVSGGIPLVNPIHMQNETICPDNNFTVSEEMIKELQNYRLFAGDVIFARRGDIGRCALVRERDNGFLCGTGSLFVRPVQPVDSFFFVKMMRCESMIEHLTSFAKGATMLNINCKIIEDLDIILPPLPLQQTFASKIEAIEKQKALIKQSLGEVETLFNARMQEYFD